MRHFAYTLSASVHMIRHKGETKNGKNTRRLTLCLFPDTRECPRAEQNAFCPKIRDSRPMCIRDSSDILINPRTRQNPNGLDLTSAQSRFCQPTGTLFLQKLFQEIIQIFVQPLQQFTVHYHRLIVHKVQVAKRFLVLIHQDERIRLQ